MIKARSCYNCQGTGLTKNGFCHECKGTGYFEVIDPNSETESQLLLLMTSVRKYTTQEQFDAIIKHYFEDSIATYSSGTN
jgi:DnaJ-class molecular chaperone